jgi:hypothetical protein
MTRCIVPHESCDEPGRARAAERLAELVQVDRRAARLGPRALHGVRSRRRAALSGALPHFRGTLLAALAGVIVAAAGSGGPSGISRRLALIAAASGLLLTVVAYVTGDHPAWAALAMAAVALLTSLAAAAGPLGGVLGFLLSLGYMLVATLARVSHLHESVSWRWAAAHIAVGCLGGLLVVFVGTTWRRRREPDEVKARRRARRVLDFLRRLPGSPHARKESEEPGVRPRGQHAVRRAPSGRRLPRRARPGAFSLGIVILFGGIGLAPPYPIIGGGLTTIGSVLLAGAPTGAVGNWAERRLLDTVVGCAVALVATYLLWPRDRATEEAVPVPT